MMINALNGTGNINTGEKVAKDTDYTKNEVNKAAEAGLTSDNLQSVADTGFTTYEDELKAKIDANQKQGLQIANELTDEEKLDNSTERMTKEDYKDISEEGISLEKYNVERLDRALQRIKTQRAVYEDNIGEQKEKLETKEKNVEKMAYSGVEDKVVKKLESSNLPVTDENIAKLSNAMDLAAASYQISDTAKSYLIKNNVEPTIENIYKAQYSGGYSKTNKITEETFQSLKGQINDIIEKAGLELNEENTNSAKWLLNQNIPLTEDNLWSCKDLNLIQNNYSEDEILDKTVEAMVNGSSPESASLSQIGSEQAAKAVNALSTISDEAVQLAVSQKQDGNIASINCRDLLKAQKQLSQETKKEEKTTGEEPGQVTVDSSEDTDQLNTEGLDIKTITVRRQLEEIRLKMTLDAGSQLIKKGFNLDTDSLSKIVDGLKEIENQYYKNLLEEGNATVTNDNVQILKGSIEGIEELKGMPSYVLGATLTNKKLETVNGLLSTGTEIKGSFEKANEAYETLMTKPRADMGDSIKKAFRNVDDILEDMKLETTQANERAVRILGYNGINITADNILQAKAYDEQVNRLMNNFHPAVAVELIKKGENPLDMPIEELNQQIDTIKTEIGVTEEEQYSKYLWKLEKNKELSEDEKKSYIGIYRLLNTVQKTDGAAVGAVIKADQEVTMKNLLTAVRTMKSGGIDSEVDDNFGALSQLTFNRENITDQINSSFSGTDMSATDQSKGSSFNNDTQEDKFNYINNLLKDIMSEVSPEKLAELGNTDAILNMSVEKVHEEVIFSENNTESEQSYWDEKLGQFNDLAEDSKSAIQYLKNFNLPTSLENVQAAKDIINKDYTVFKQLKNLSSLKDADKETAATEENIETIGSNAETSDSSFNINDISEKLINALTGQESMANEYKALEQDVNKLLNQYYENQTITSQDITTLQRINYGMSFIQKLASKENYEIPLAVGDSVTNVNVTILHNTGENGKVNIEYESQAFGKISVDLTVKDENANILFTCDSRSGRDTFAGESDVLRKAISDTGIEVKQLNYSIGNKISDSDRYTNNSRVNETDKNGTENQEKVTTNTLYRMAKTVLVHIKQLEISNE